MPGLGDELGSILGDIVPPHLDMPTFINNTYTVGPFSITCLLADGHGSTSKVFSRQYYGFSGEHAAVPVRSLSKMVASAAFLALVERPYLNVSLHSRLADYFPECEGSLLADATPVQMMSMRTALDNRINAAWKAHAGMGDHAGFPPYCDARGLSVEECITDVVCPAYAERAPTQLPVELHAHVNETLVCADGNANCPSWAAAGECGANPNYMYEVCILSCGFCKADVEVNSTSLGGHGWWSEDKEGEQPKARLRHRMKCSYDNLSYMLLDGLVGRSTGRPLLSWLIELVARKVGMRDLLRCVDVDGPVLGGIEGCYRKSSSPEMCIDPSSWERWAGGSESRTWAPNSLFASATDMASFLGMLANRGVARGTRVLSETSVRLMFSDLNDDGLDCQGMDTFGLGIGHCAVPDTPASKCQTAEWWGWGGTYGSRVWFFPRRRGGFGGGLVCAAISNAPTEGEPRSPSGELVRIGGRQHAFAHTFAVGVRRMFPLYPEVL